MPKLTLHIPENMVAAAKSEAAARHVSVSKLVTDYFATLAAKPSVTDGATDHLAPRTRRLAGCIPNAETRDYLAHIEKKHT